MDNKEMVARHCEVCGGVILRKRYRGKLENILAYESRRVCSAKCGGVLGGGNESDIYVYEPTEEQIAEAAAKIKADNIEALKASNPKPIATRHGFRDSVNEGQRRCGVTVGSV